MDSKNLLSVYQSCSALQRLGPDVLKKYGPLKSHEVRVLNKFCEIMINNGCSIKQLDGFYVSFSIGQIGKEFDLLRFGSDFVLNIELKSELKKSASDNEKKIYKQMHENLYYLNFLELPIAIFTFVESDGFYKLNTDGNGIHKVDALEVVEELVKQSINESADPDKLFIPSNYLISPFNSTKKFMMGEYFLTSAQQKNKEEIKAELLETPFKFICLSANAGTGKTLLLYDIVKEQLSERKRALIIHCGKLNYGHELLINRYHWNIISIKDVPCNVSKWDKKGIDLIVVDESQRIHVNQLNCIIQEAINLQIPVIFSFDTKQYLKSGETTNIAEYLKNEFPSVPFSI